MSLTTRLIAGLLIAVIAATLTAVLQTGAMLDPVLLAGYAAACVASVLIGSRSSGQSAPARGDAASPARREAPRSTGTAAPAAGDRELGRVKWFNVSKGFGFITRDNGEEIFVHFRSIRGSGRRGLRDGQRVSFVVGETEKGPQAEDVLAEEQDQA